MRLVLQYTVSDDCTYWATVTLPVDHDSPEDFLSSLELLARNASLAPNLPGRIPGSFRMRGVGQPLYYEDFIQKGVFVAPTIMTLEEWFEGTKE